LVVRIAVWLMGRKVYAASAAAGTAYVWFFTESDGDEPRDIAGLVDCGAIKPVIHREFAFEQLPEALAYLEAGRARGKVVPKVRLGHDAFTRERRHCWLPVQISI